MTSYAIVCADLRHLERAQEISDYFSIPLLKKIDPTLDFFLSIEPTGLLLHSPKTQYKPFAIDWNSKNFDYRRKNSQTHSEKLVKAMGKSPKTSLRVIDACAGLGTDGFVLAAHGFQVTLIERSPLIAALLFDALLRLKDNDPEIAARIQCVFSDAKSYLMQNEAEIIYLDPMFPGISASEAKRRKEIVLLRIMGGDNPDAEELFEIALLRAKQRVVVKRALKSPTLGKTKPNGNVAGKLCRFDIYSR